MTETSWPLRKILKLRCLSAWTAESSLPSTILFLSVLKFVNAEGVGGVAQRSELQTNTRAKHCMPGIVNVRVEIHLPEPFWPIVISSYTRSMNVFARVYMTGLEHAVERDAVAPVYLVPVSDVSVLLAGVQAHVKNGKRLNAIIITQPVTDSEGH